MHLPSTLASSLPLNDLASALMRSPFSGETAMSTTVQSPGSPSPRSSGLGVLASVHAAKTSSALANTAATHRRRVIDPSWCKSAEIEQHPRIGETGRVVEIGGRPAFGGQQSLQLLRHVAGLAALH